MYPIQIDLRSCKDFMFESNFVYAEDLKGELSPHDDPRMKQYFNDA
jgi:hypothetical protein